MSHYTRKSQVLFTPEQYELIAEVARQQGKAVGVVIREAVERCLILDLARERKRRALAEIVAMAQERSEGTEPDWDAIEAQIAKSAQGDNCPP